MVNSVAEKLMISKLNSVRWIAFILGISNLGVIFMALILIFSHVSDCGGGKILPLVVVAAVAAVRIMSMVGTGIAQEATATTILSQQLDSSVAEAVIRHERRMRYKRWLWWTRFGTGITMLQFTGATYLLFITIKDASYDGKSSGCFAVQAAEKMGWKQILFSVFLIFVWLLVIIQCFTGSDVLKWRSFYATHDNAWKAHYREVFDHRIREFLCCLGRAKYMSIMEEDEVYSVARLLGDLVAYRATGTGHLELLAGLALLQRHREPTTSYEEHMEAPEASIREAAALHQFAEAAYTGPLLDFGRNPVLFPCAWLYRQGVLTPWTRNRRPVLEGDNWWRGHAAAFLKYVDLPPEALRRGRVNQAKREAAYFIVVLHHLRSVVIAVRGTETPEDVITDGLCRECTLSTEDLDGLIKKVFHRTYSPLGCNKFCSDHLASHVKQHVISSFPHYGHSGIVEAARELYMQVDGHPKDKDGCLSETTGFLSSLLGAGCECDGYNLRIVGHSLGGAVGTLLGLRLYRRYPNLHVYSYGPPPCVNLVVAEACSDFVTSIIYNDEFSARLSINSILRLREAAIAALANDSSANSAMICTLARRILHANWYHQGGEKEKITTPSLPSGAEDKHIYRRKHYKYMIKGGVFLCVHAFYCMLNVPSHDPSSILGNEDLVRCAVNASVGSLQSRQHKRANLESENISHMTASAFTAGSEPSQDAFFDEANHFDDIPDLEIVRCNLDEYNNSNATNTCFERSEVLPSGDSVSLFTDNVPSIEVTMGESPEVFLPGLIIHIVPEKRRKLLPLWKIWHLNDRENGYRAFLANRESFRDIIVTPYMFIDHMPWR